MTLGELYRRAVATGMERDLRGSDPARADLDRTRKAWDELGEDERAYFDRERLNNPYPDSRILHGPEGTELAAVLVGIDIGEGELVLADRLREKGRALSAVVSHHPSGHALAQLPGVMQIQAGIHSHFGVPIARAEGILAPRAKEVAERLHPLNHQRAVDAARLLELPLACLHTPADNCVASYLTGRFDAERPDTLADLLELLHAIPEYQAGRREQAGPVLVAGDKQSRAGRVFVDMTGGTEGAKEMYQKFAQSTDISTVVGMHLSKEHLEEARKHHLNVVIAGHIASDNLGMNLLLDEALDPEVEVLEAGGFRRVERRDA